MVLHVYIQEMRHKIQVIVTSGLPIQHIVEDCFGTTNSRFSLAPQTKHIHTYTVLMQSNNTDQEVQLHHEAYSLTFCIYFDQSTDVRNYSIYKILYIKNYTLWQCIHYLSRGVLLTFSDPLRGMRERGVRGTLVEACSMCITQQ